MDLIISCSTKTNRKQKNSSHTSTNVKQIAQPSHTNTCPYICRTCELHTNAKFNWLAILIKHDEIKGNICTPKIQLDQGSRKSKIERVCYSEPLPIDRKCNWVDRETHIKASARRLRRCTVCKQARKRKLDSFCLRAAEHHDPTSRTRWGRYGKRKGLLTKRERSSYLSTSR